MTEETPKKKSLAGLGQMLEKAAAEEKPAGGKATWVSAEDAGPVSAEKTAPPKSKTAKKKASTANAAETRSYEITFRKKSSH